MHRVIRANPGKILTNGVTYARVLYLPMDKDPNAFYEIEESEYEKMRSEEESK